MTIRNLFRTRQPPPRRFAFLLGNAAYTHLTPLRNPATDIANISRQLTELGYDVSKCCDRDCRNTWFELEEFFKRAGDCDAIVLYYSGHGVQLGGDNYIVPIDFDPGVPAQHDIGEDEIAGLVKVQDVMTGMASAKARLIFLDACRDGGGLQQVRVQTQPAVAPGQSNAYSAAVATRSLNGDPRPGLAKLRLDKSQKQSFICFAAEPGDFAEDGPEGGMSPFSEAVHSHISIRGLDVFGFSQRIARTVRERTEGRQTPWTNSNLTERFAFHPADTKPVWILGALGALTGFLGALLSFKLFGIDCAGNFGVGDLKLHDVRAYPYYLLLPLMFGTVLGYGAYRWGNRSWNAAIGTCLIYAACAALSRFWIAPYARDPDLLQNLKKLTPGDFTGELQIPVRLMLLTAILAAGLAGAASIFSAAPYVRDMGKMPRIATGALLGAAGALLFLLFLLVRAHVDGMSTGGYSWLQPFGIIVLLMVWEALLGINAGYAYSKPSNE